MMFGALSTNVVVMFCPHSLVCIQIDGYDGRKWDFDGFMLSIGKIKVNPMSK